MPTIMTHAAVPICLGLGLGTRVIPPRLLFSGIVLAMLPDADVLAFKFGIAYGNVFVGADVGMATGCSSDGMPVVASAVSLGFPAAQRLAGRPLYAVIRRSQK